MFLHGIDLISWHFYSLVLMLFNNMFWTPLLILILKSSQDSYALLEGLHNFPYIKSIPNFGGFLQKHSDVLIFQNLSLCFKLYKTQITTKYLNTIISKTAIVLLQIYCYPKGLYCTQYCHGTWRYKKLGILLCIKTAE